MEHQNAKLKRKPFFTVSLRFNDTLDSSVNKNNLRTYSARYLHSEIELLHFRARYYDPNLGEFISRDPLEYVDGMSLYRGYFVPGQLDSNGTQVKTSVKDFWKDNCDCVAGATAGIDVDHLGDENIWKNRKKDPFKGWNDNANKCFLVSNINNMLGGTMRNVRNKWGGNISVADFEKINECK